MISLVGGAIGLAVAVSILLLAMVSFGLLKPTERTATQDFKKRISEGSIPIELIRLHKLNAVSADNSYKMECDAEVKFMSDCLWRNGCWLMGKEMQGDRNPTTTPRAWEKYNVKRGQRIKLFGIIRYVKTDKGWRPEGFNFCDDEAVLPGHSK